MACRTNLWLITSILLFQTLKLQVAFGQQVPCYFIFGDSLVDNGNNNNLFTAAKVNYPPYGIDFASGPTGRFTNGRTIDDIISQLLGFPNFIPPFASATGNGILRGVNYASGGSGILPYTGYQLGQVISLDGQLNNHQTTVSRINQLQGNATFTSQYLSRCIYTIGMGSNDYINNYLRPEAYFTAQIYTPQAYATLLIQTYTTQLQTLYNLGARKIAVFSLGLVGCTPAQISMFGTNGSPCVDNTNNIVKLFDDQLKPLIQQLNTQYPDANFTLLNTTSLTSGNPAAAGITVLNAPCCNVSSISGLCIPFSTPCSNRTQYAFYDAYHPSEIANLGTASRSYIAQSPFDVYPVDIRRLAQL